MKQDDERHGELSAQMARLQFPIIYSLTPMMERIGTNLVLGTGSDSIAGCC
jgi:hypothetical protein